MSPATNTQHPSATGTSSHTNPLVSKQLEIALEILETCEIQLLAVVPKKSHLSPFHAMASSNVIKECEGKPPGEEYMTEEHAKGEHTNGEHKKGEHDQTDAGADQTDSSSKKKAKEIALQIRKKCTDPEKNRDIIQKVLNKCKPGHSAELKVSTCDDISEGVVKEKVSKMMKECVTEHPHPLPQHTTTVDSTAHISNDGAHLGEMATEDPPHYEGDPNDDPAYADAQDPYHEHRPPAPRRRPPPQPSRPEPPKKKKNIFKRIWGWIKDKTMEHNFLWLGKKVEEREARKKAEKEAKYNTPEKRTEHTEHDHHRTDDQQYNVPPYEEHDNGAPYYDPQQEHYNGQPQHADGYQPHHEDRYQPHHEDGYQPHHEDKQHYYQDAEHTAHAPQQRH